MAEQNDAWLSVWIDGERYDEATGRVLALEVDECADEASSFRMSLDLTPVERDWDLLADGRFALLHQISIELGVGPLGADEPAQKAFVFHGYITAVEPHFGEKRVPDSTLTLRGIDASCLMHFEERTRAWSDVTDADIVKSIYQAYGFAVDVAPTKTVRSATRGPLVQRTTDAELVRMLARRNGFEAYVERTDAPPAKGAAAGSEVVGHFHLPRLDAPVQPRLELMPRDTPSILEMTASWESHRPTAVLGAHVDEKTRRIRSSRIDAPLYKRLGTTSRADILRQRFAAILPSMPKTESTMRQIVDVPYEQDEVDSLAWADYREADWLATATGRVHALRYPTILRARRPVEIAGAGKLLDGAWYVRRAGHRWMRDQASKRYEVDVSLARNALGGVG
jgi:hypothetical protein